MVVQYRLKFLWKSNSTANLPFNCCNGHCLPDCWIGLELIEGKNRQVRKMTAAVGFPTLRLIRMQIEDLKIDKMENGRVQEIAKAEFYSLLKLKP